MYSAPTCTILPPIFSTIYFHAYSIPGAALEQFAGVFLRFIASRWLLHGLFYVIAEDHPNTRLDSDRNPFQYPGTGSPMNPRGRTDQAVLLHSTALPFLDYFHRPGPLPVRSSFAGVANYRTIASSAGQHGCCDCLVGVTFDVLVTTHPTVSWSRCGTSVP